MLQKGDRIEKYGIWATVTFVAGKDVRLDYDNGDFEIGPWAGAEPDTDAPDRPTLDPRDYTAEQLRNAILRALDMPTHPHDDPWLDPRTLARNVALRLTDGTLGYPGGAFQGAVSKVAEQMASEGLIREIEAGEPHLRGGDGYYRRIRARTPVWQTVERAEALERALEAARAELMRQRASRLGLEHDLSAPGCPVLPAPTDGEERLTPSGSSPLELTTEVRVTCEEYYQDVIATSRPNGWDGNSWPLLATLVFGRNPHSESDAPVVEVRLGDTVVGYLTAAMSERHGPSIASVHSSGRQATAAASVRCTKKRTGVIWRLHVGLHRVR
jgi:hypothetical protein